MMIKENKGVTLTTVVVTILVLIMIAAISITLGKEILYQVGDYKKETEISMLQNAVFQRYMLLKAENKDGKTAPEIQDRISLSADMNRPRALIGTRIGNLSILREYEFNNYKESYANVSEMTYEEYYYYLYDSDLKELGVERDASDKNTNRSYIVNYSTGEVFDVTNKVYYVSNKDIYLEGSTSNIEETEYNNFTDE